MAIEIVDFPMKNGWIFHSYVKLPEGRWMIGTCIPSQPQNYLGLSETWVTPHSIVWFRTSFFPKKSSFNLQGHSTWSAPQCPVRVYLVADLESRTQEGLRMVAMVAMVAVCWFHSRGKWDWDFRQCCLGMLYAVNGKNRLRYALVHLVPHNTGNHWEVCF
jgi:hypothetical protein